MRGSGTRGRGRRGAGALALAAALALGLRSAGTQAELISIPGPPLPPQPLVPARSCTYTPPAPGALHLVASEASAGAMPSYQLLADPWTPCRLYRAGSDQSLQRSDDGGATWTQVFADSAQNATTGAAFSASALVAGRRDTVLLGERGNGDAMVRSGDAGASWTVPTYLGSDSVEDVAVSPADPAQAWAVGVATRCAAVPVAAAAPALSLPGGGSAAVPQQACADEPNPTLYRSGDGGATWSPTFDDWPFLPDLLRCGSDAQSCVDALQILPDPAAANHLFLFAPNSSGSFLLESRDGGTTFALQRCGIAASAAAVVRQQDTTRVLLLTPSQTPQLTVADTTCTVVTAGVTAQLPHLTDPAVVADPRQPHHAVLAGITPDGVLQVLSSGDAFASATALHSATLAGLHAPALRLDTPLRAPSDGVSRDSRLLLQFDRSGSLLVAAQETCASGCAWAHRQSYYRMAPVFTSVPSPTHSSGGGGGGGGGQPPAPPPLGGPMRTVAQCAEVPAPPGSSRNGSIAFDGRYLDWSDGENPAPFHALVHRLDPTTCRPVADLDVTFPPAEVGNNPQTPIDKMVADWNTNQLLAIEGQFGTGGIFAIRILDEGGPGRVARGVATHLMAVGSCSGTPGDTLIAYDYTDDTLWTCAGSPGAPGHVDMAGNPIATCFSTFGVGGARSNTANISSWTLGAPRRMFMTSEDDTDIYAYDALTCGSLATYSHPQYQESEDEQIACDAVSFGPQSGVARPTSVFWVRDAGGRLAAYAFDGGLCPQATSLAYSGPTSVDAGREATLCATISLPNRTLAPARLPVDFDLAGTPIGTAATDDHGVACVRTTVDRTAGMYTVGARFAGLPGFQPAEDEGALRVVQIVRLPAPILPPPPAAAVPVAAAAAKPPVAPGAPVARGGGETVQVQTQPAPQNAQMPQPVVSNQREQQLQPALGYAVQGGGEELHPDGAYAMSALGDGGVMGRQRRLEGAAAVVALLGARGAGAAAALQPARRRRGPRGVRRR